MRWKQAPKKIPHGLMDRMKLVLQNTPALLSHLTVISLSTNLLFLWNNRLNGRKDRLIIYVTMVPLSDSAKIRGSIMSRHSEEEDDDMDTELLLPSVPIAGSSVMFSGRRAPR
jgi:hypothetical protein